MNPLYIFAEQISFLILTFIVTLMAQPVFALTTECEKLVNSNLIVNGAGTLFDALNCLASGAGAFFELFF